MRLVGLCMFGRFEGGERGSGKDEEEGGCLRRKFLYINFASMVKHLWMRRAINFSSRLVTV